jgi:hypothetical protein
MNDCMNVPVCIVKRKICGQKEWRKATKPVKKHFIRYVHIVVSDQDVFRDIPIEQHCGLYSTRA